MKKLVSILHLLGELEEKLVAESKRPDRLSKLGTPPTNVGITERDAVLSRYWKYVDKREASQCWPWKGHTNEYGYGVIQIQNRVLISSRVAFVLSTGRDPIALVCHRCDNPKCVNPNHLFEGDDKVNHDDAVSKGRKQPKKIK